MKELIIEYPRVNSTLPGWTSLIKMNRFKKYHNIGLALLRKEYGFNPDLVHVNIMNPVGLIAKKWLKSKALPYVITEHWTGYLDDDGRYEKSKVLKLALPKIANRSKIMLPVSHDLKLALEKKGLGKKFTVIPNVVDTTIFNFKTQERSFLLVVADLVNAQKNISGIIQTLAVLKQKGFLFDLKIAGGGEDEEEIKQSVKKLNLQDQVEFLGRVRAEELARLYNKALATVLFSNYENLPCVIAESFCCGTPVIATKVGGIPEIITAENGILIHPKDKIALESAILKVGNEQWDNNKIANDAKNKFGMAAVGLELNKIYTNCIESN